MPTLVLHVKAFLALVLVALLICLVPSPAMARELPPHQPRLILLLVIDQFSYDYLGRFSGRFGDGGFRFLMDNGANFTNCKYKQATTVTAAGHSIIATGAYPWATGIISNEWYSRGKGREVMAVSDDSVNLVGGSGPGASARMMLGTTIGDQLKLSSNGRSKVIALSIKDRGALFLAGRLGNGAYWWDTRTGNFVSSSQFGSVLPAWLRSFNDQRYADKFFGKTWQRLLPENTYAASTRDDYAYERPFPGAGRQFPHVITGGLSHPGEAFYGVFSMTPFANQMLADAAGAAIDAEGLGQRGDTDLLAISFSSPDLLGHSFGPYSQEMEDMFLRLDQTLAALFKHIDEKVGLNRCLVVLTGDHGNVPIPEFLKERGADAGRIDPRAFMTLLDAALDARLGPDDWITAFTAPNLYLNLETIDRQKYRQPDVEALAAKLAHSIAGVSTVYTAAQLFTNQVPAGPYADAVRRSYYWGRSGELVVVPKPGYIFSSEPQGTSHGSPYNPDAQVPLILCGTSIRGGRYGTDCSPADIAPTVAAVAGTGIPSLCEGRVLTEALAQVAGPPRPITKPAAEPQPQEIPRRRR